MGSLLGDEGFRVALAVALVGAGLASWCATRRIGPMPTAAVTIVATLAGLRAEHHLTFSLVLGLALLGVAAWASRAGAGFVTAGIAVLAGVVILGSAYPDGFATWVVVVVALTMLPTVPLLELRARKWRRLAPLVLLGAAVGVYVCVPDTEFLRPLIAAAGVTAFLALLPEGSVSQVGSGAVVGYLLWAVGLEGVGRPGAVIGALGCIVALVLFPALPAAWPWPRAWWLHAAAAALLVLWCSRVAGLLHSGWLAALVVVAGFAVAVAVRLVVGGRARFRPR